MERKRNVRLMFGSDVLMLGLNLDFLKEGDKRNERAARLIKKASMIYIGAGKQYEEMVKDVADNALKEYMGWYTENIFNVVMSNPVHLMKDGDTTPIPKYDVNKYDIGQYFDGLNKEVFEELQKLIFYLNHPESDEAFKTASEMSKDDTDFPVHTKDFFVLAHSILIATLEGREFLDRMEKIFSRYELPRDQEESIKSEIEKNLFDPSDIQSDKEELEKRLSINKIVKDFLANPRNN
jgi:hypothetical protein